MLNQKPYVLTDLSLDDPTRGDSRAYEGLGREVAKILGMGFLCIDKDYLKQRFNACAEREANFVEFILKEGTPAIVFNSQIGIFERQILESRGVRMFISEMAESLQKHYAPQARYNGLAPHNLTPGLLRKEGETFNAAYGALPSPLVAVMLASLDDPYDTAARQLVSACRDFETATLFLCGSRRTDPKLYCELLMQLGSELERYGMEDRIRVTGYSMDDHRAHRHDALKDFNPYIGLISRADYVVICNFSRSMISEVLAAGKPVHFCNTNWHKEFNLHRAGFSPVLLRKGYIRNLLDEVTGLATLNPARFRPIDITARIAKGIVNAYKNFKPGPG